MTTKPALPAAPRGHAGLPARAKADPTGRAWLEHLTSTQTAAAVENNRFLSSMKQMIELMNGTTGGATPHVDTPAVGEIPFTAASTVPIGTQTTPTNVTSAASTTAIGAALNVTNSGVLQLQTLLVVLLAQFNAIVPQHNAALTTINTVTPALLETQVTVNSVIDQVSAG